MTERTPHQPPHPSNRGPQGPDQQTGQHGPHSGRNTVQAPPTPEKKRTGLKIAAGTLAGLTLVGLAGLGLSKLSNNEHAPEGDKKESSQTFYRANQEQSLATYGDRATWETQNSWGGNENGRIEAGDFVGAVQDIKDTIRYNSELAATFLTEGDYEAAGVPVPDIDSFERDKDGKIIDVERYTAEVNHLGGWLFENSEMKDGSPVHPDEYKKIEEAHKWIDGELDRVAPTLGQDDVIELKAGTSIWTPYLHENNANAIDPNFILPQDSKFLTVTINGHMLMLKASCNWQISGLVTTPPVVETAPVQQAAYVEQAQPQYTLQSSWKPLEQAQPEQPAPEQPAAPPQVTIPRIEIPGIPPIEIPQIPQLPPVEIPPVENLLPKNPGEDVNVNPFVIDNPDLGMGNFRAPAPTTPTPLAELPPTYVAPAAPANNGNAGNSGGGGFTGPSIESNLGGGTGGTGGGNNSTLNSGMADLS